MGSTVGRAVGPVAVTNQDLSLSHVMRRGGANVWTVWLEISVTAVVVVTTVSTTMTAQVVKQKVTVSPPRLVVSLDSDWV